MTPLDTVRFPQTDIAAIARGFGFDGVTARGQPTSRRCATGWRARAGARCSIDAKVTSAHGSWWLKKAFRGH